MHKHNLRENGYLITRLRSTSWHEPNGVNSGCWMLRYTSLHNRTNYFQTGENPTESWSIYVSAKRSSIWPSNINHNFRCMWCVHWWHPGVECKPGEIFQTLENCARQAAWNWVENAPRDFPGCFLGGDWLLKAWSVGLSDRATRRGYQRNKGNVSAECYYRVRVKIRTTL